MKGRYDEGTIIEEKEVHILLLASGNHCSLQYKSFNATNGLIEQDDS